MKDEIIIDGVTYVRKDTLEEEIFEIGESATIQTETDKFFIEGSVLINHDGYTMPWIEVRPKTKVDGGLQDDVYDGEGWIFDLANGKSECYADIRLYFEEKDVDVDPELPKALTFIAKEMVKRKWVKS